MKDNDSNDPKNNLLAGERVACPLKEYDDYAKGSITFAELWEIVGEHIEKCKYCKSEMALLEVIEDKEKFKEFQRQLLASDVLTKKLSPEFRKALGAYRQENAEKKFRNMANELIKNLYPADMKHAENPLQREKYFEIVSKFGSIWNELPDTKHRPAEIEALMRKELNDAGIPKYKIKQTMNYLERNFSEHQKK